MAVLNTYVLISDLTLRNLVLFSELEREDQQLRAPPALDSIILQLVSVALEERFGVDAQQEF